MFAKPGLSASVLGTSLPSSFLVCLTSHLQKSVFRWKVRGCGIFLFFNIFSSVVGKRSLIFVLSCAEMLLDLKQLSCFDLSTSNITITF